MVPCNVLRDVLSVGLALINIGWSWLLWVDCNVPCTGHYLMRDVLPAGCPNLGGARCPDLGRARCLSLSNAKYPGVHATPWGVLAA